MKWLYIIIPIITLLFGIWLGSMLSNDNSIKQSEVQTAISNITIYTNKIFTEYEYITATSMGIPTDQFPLEVNMVIDKYNSLLTDSRKVAYDFAILQKDYDRLNKINNRKLFFIVGGQTQYSIKRSLADIGILAGIEYKRFGILGGYMFFNQTITLSAYYRF